MMRQLLFVGFLITVCGNVSSWRLDLRQVVQVESKCDVYFKLLQNVSQTLGAEFADAFTWGTGKEVNDQNLRATACNLADVKKLEDLANVAPMLPLGDIKEEYKMSQRHMDEFGGVDNFIDIKDTEILLYEAYQEHDVSNIQWKELPLRADRTEAIAYLTDVRDPLRKWLSFYVMRNTSVIVDIFNDVPNLVDILMRCGSRSEVAMELNVSSDVVENLLRNLDYIPVYQRRYPQRLAVLKLMKQMNYDGLFSL